MKQIFRRAALYAASGAALSSLAACATVTRGDHTAWEIRTAPSGASVRTSNNMVCESTPCSLKMARRSEFDATITKEGYKSVKVHVTHKISNAGGMGMAGNVVLGGVIGAGVDVASGAMYDLTPNPVDVTLERETPVAVVDEKSVQSISTAPVEAASTPPMPAATQAAPLPLPARPSSGD